MKIQKLVLSALMDGTAERDENNNVTVKIGSKTHLVQINDEMLKAYERQLETELEQAETDYADAESLMAAAKIKIEAAKKRKESKKAK